jgi:hypothetical protein
MNPREGLRSAGDRRRRSTRDAVTPTPRRHHSAGKVVDWFVARRTGGELRLEPIFDEAAFYDREEALNLLTFPADREMARRAFAAAGGGPGTFSARP